MPRPKGILFDLDDTILAFDIVAAECWEQVCQEYRDRLPSISAEQLLTEIRHYAGWFWSDPERHRENRQNLALARRRIVSGAMHKLLVEDEPLANQIADRYSEERDRRIFPFPGAIETLEQLRSQGIPLGLITNGAAKAQRAKLVQFGLESLFDVVVIEGEFGVGKPDERVYAHALVKLGLSASAVWMVGDHLEWDVAAPQRLGIRGIWIDHVGRGVPTGSAVHPDRILRHVAELLQELQVK